MNHILVIFGTTEGHTRRVAECLGVAFRTKGLVADVVEAGIAELSPDAYNGVVVCASIHGGRYQRSVIRWTRDNAAGLSKKPTAFVSVCLAVLQKDPKVHKDLDAIVARFVRATGWQPKAIKQVAGALLYREYGFFKRWVMKRIVAQAGGDTDTSRDYEYTNWAELLAFANEFAVLVEAAGNRLEPAAGF